MKLISWSLVISLTAMGAGSLCAQTYRIWNNDGTGNALWSNPANWSGGNVPDSVEEWATLRNEEGDRTVVLDGNYTVGRLSFDYTRQVPEGFVLEGDGVLTVDVNDERAFRLGVIASGPLTYTINTDVVIANSKRLVSNVQAHVNGSRLVLNGNLIGKTYINFGGVSGGVTEVNGGIVNQAGLRFGQGGVVTIGGEGRASGSGGNLVFHSGTTNLNRKDAVSGRQLIVSGASTVNFNASDAVAGALNVSIEKNAKADWTFAAAQQTFGMLTLAGRLEIALGAGSQLTFADSASRQWAGDAVLELTIAEGASVRFGSSASALSEAQLGVITVNGKRAVLDGSGYLKAAQ